MVKAVRVSELEQGDRVQWDGLFRFLERKAPHTDEFYIVLIFQGFAHPVIVDEADIVLVIADP